MCFPLFQNPGLTLTGNLLAAGEGWRILDKSNRVSTAPLLTGAQVFLAGSLDLFGEICRSD
jgi:hypothetical protein